MSPYFLLRHPRRGWDTRSPARHQPSQSRPRALCDLAVLLGRPAVGATERNPGDLAQLARENETLVGGQLPREQLDLAQLVAEHDELLELRTLVDDRDLFLSDRPQRDGGLERRVYRAASSHGPAAVADAGEESLLERPAGTHATGEAAPSARVGNELERGLAVAVLEVLPTQEVAVGPQQKLPLGPRDHGQLLGGIRPFSPRE